MAVLYISFTDGKDVVRSLNSSRRELNDILRKLKNAESNLNGIGKKSSNWRSKWIFSRCFRRSSRSNS
ncbi:MAG: hypothetical protein E7214_02330 [Clostridium sp.]|nr:hypothetical protein [Clostridium sp.]